MNSFIILGKDSKVVKDYSQKLAVEQGISKFDIYSYQTEKAIGIEDVRNLSKQIFLKPQHSDRKAIILEAFLGASTEAQNAMLKVLEEPPQDTIILILASENYFLPTILSRVKLIDLGRIEISKEEEKEFTGIISDLNKHDLGWKLKLAQDLSKDRQEALLFLEKLIIVARNIMVGDTNQTKAISKNIKLMQKFYKEIKESNVNLRLALENLFVQWHA